MFIYANNLSPGINKFVQDANYKGYISAIVHALPNCHLPGIAEVLCHKLLTAILTKGHEFAEVSALKYICSLVPMFRYCGQKWLQILSSRKNHVIPDNLPDEIRKLLRNSEELPGVLCEEASVVAFLRSAMGVKKLESAEFLLKVVFPAVNAKQLCLTTIEMLMNEIIDLKKKDRSVFDKVRFQIEDLAFVRTHGGQVLRPNQCIDWNHIEKYFPHLTDTIGTMLAKDTMLNTTSFLHDVGLRTKLSADEVLLAAQSVDKSETPVAAAGFLVAYIAYHYVGNLDTTHNIKLENGNELFSALCRVAWLPLQEVPQNWKGLW